MLFNFFIFVSWFFGVLGSYFILSGTIGLLRNKNFYMKVQCAYLICIYGITFVILALGINSCDPNIFFKCLFFSILNLISALSVLHCFSRKAFFYGIKFDCKERKDLDDILLEKARAEIKRQEEEKQRKLKEELKEKQRLEKLKREEALRKQKEEEEAYEREKDDIQEKIKEQKKKLKDKITKARMNAKITRKQEEIDKTEKMIQEILTKYGLTEEMLNEE